MALFNSLVRPDQVPKVVDLGHVAFDKFFIVAGQVGLAEEAERHAVQVVALFVASPDPAAMEAYAVLQRWLPRLRADAGP